MPSYPEPKVYNEDDPHCRECVCPGCKYFHINDGDCNEGCYDCGTIRPMSVDSCLMFEEAE